MSNPFDENESVWARDAAKGEVTPLTHDVDCDVAIIGGGFTGTSTAYHLRRRFPERRVVLLEARTLGNGASGRNGGLALNWINGVPHDDMALTKRIWDVTKGGIDAIEARIREHDLQVPWQRRAVLDLVTDDARADAAEREVEKLAAAGIPLRFVRGAALEAFGRFEGARGAVVDATAGQLDGFRFLQAMRGVLGGVSIYEETPVTRVEESETCTLHTPRGRVRARAVVLATNAYTPRLGYFQHGIVPLQSHVFATSQLSAEEWAKIGWGPELGGFSDDYDRIAYGSMTTDGRLVFGGGSNEAYGYGFGNATAFTGDRARAQRAMEESLYRYLPGARGVRIEHRWSGPVGITLSRVCTIGNRKNVYYALGFSGHGVVLANLAGEVLADLYAGDASRWEGLPFFQQKLLFVPPEPMRWLGYQVYTRLTGRSPRRSL